MKEAITTSCELHIPVVVLFIDLKNAYCYAMLYDTKRNNKECRSKDSSGRNNKKKQLNQSRCKVMRIKDFRPHTTLKLTAGLLGVKIT